MSPEARPGVIISKEGGDWKIRKILEDPQGELLFLIRTFRVVLSRATN